MSRLSLPRPLALAALGFAAAVAVTLSARPQASAADDKGAKAPDPAAVERTRAIVKMLDDVHKGYVVTITDTYVKAQERTPAATVVKKVFSHMEKAGHGTGRLIDASGQPLRAANVAKTEFEKKAVAAIKGGKPYFEEVATKDGKPVLRAATVVPAVMPACVTCHPHVKEGQVLGALVYELPVR